MVQDHHVVGQGLDVRQVMARDDNRLAAVGNLTETCPEGHLPGRVETVEGLVEKQELWITNQRRAQGETLPHPLRVLVDLSSGVGLQANEFEHLIDTVMAEAELVGRHLEVDPPGERPDQTRLFDDGPDLLGHLDQATWYLLTKDEDAPGVGPRKTEERAEEGRLARPVRTEQPGYRAGGDNTIETIERGGRLVTLDQALDLDRRIVEIHVAGRPSDMAGQSTTAWHPVNHDVIGPDPDTHEVDARSTCRRRQTCDVSSLPGTYGIDGVSIGSDGPHLDDNASSPIEGEEVELAATDLHVAAHDIEPMAGEEPGGDPLAHLPHDGPIG